MTPPALTQEWSEIAPWPHGAWSQALTAWTGTEVLLFAGRVDHGGASGPAPELPTENAAGAFDPASGRWRSLAVAPFSLYGAKLVTTSRNAYVLAFERGATSARTARLWEYSVTDDAWQELARPPVNRAPGIAAAGNSLVAWTTYPAIEIPSLVHRYDIATDAWHALPRNPWVDYRARSVAAMKDGRLVLVEGPLDTPNRFAAKRVRYWRAAVLEPGADKWRKLAESPIPTGDNPATRIWTAYEERIINADPRTVTGWTGEQVPVGGYFDLRTDRWKSLDGPPGDAHVRQQSEKGAAHPDIGWNTRDLIRATGDDMLISNGWGYAPRVKGWCEMAPIPGDKHGLDTFVAVWAGDRMLFWSNGEVDPTPDGLGYRLKAAKRGWAWSPRCATAAA